MTAEEMYSRLKAMVDWKREFLMVRSLQVTARSLGETRRNGGTLFSVTLNQGFSVPTECCARYAKYREGLPAAQRRLLESAPFVALTAKTHGLKAVAFVMDLLDKGVHLDCQAIAHDRNWARGNDRVIHDFTNYDRSDRLLLSKYEKAAHAFWEAHRE